MSLDIDIPPVQKYKGSTEFRSTPGKSSQYIVPVAPFSSSFFSVFFAKVDHVRQEVIALAHTVVVKIGTNVLAGPDGTLALERVQALADQVQRIRDTGRKVALVSSGAIGAGIGRLGL